MVRETERSATRAEADAHALRELEARFRALVDTSSQGTFVHRDFVPLFANQALADIFGYSSPEEILALERIDTILFPAHEATRLRRYGNARLRGEPAPHIYEVEAARRDGTQLLLHNVVTVVSWDGAPAIMVHVVDVTEHERERRKLRENERLLRTVVANSPVILWSIDRDGIVTISEGKGLAAQGLGPSEVVGRSIFEIYASSPEFLANVERALAGAAFSAVNETGGALYERWFQPVRDAAGRIDGVIGVSVDVTEHVIAERRSAESQRLLRSVIDALPHFVFLKDRELRYRVVNQSFARFCGLSVEQITGMHSDELPDRTKADRRLLAQNDRRVLERGATVRRSAYGARTPDGELADFEATELPLWDDAGGIAGLVGVVDDVTEVRRVRRELERYREHLEELVEARTAELTAAQDELMRAERLAAIGQLTATVGHELRNPLGTISATFASLRSALTADPRAERRVTRIERNINRCVRIIDELLDYTRVRQLQLEQVDLDDWLHEATADLALPAGVELALETCTNVRLAIDSERLRQAVVNLIGNACQAIVEADDDSRPELGTVRVRTASDDEQLTITVSDNGPGIDADTVERIFDPLFSTRTFGIGLGLPLVQLIAEQHGGGVHCESTPGQGATFTLWLPRSAEPAMVEPPTAEPRP
jgi:PAS domain S-box-containing protein